ncbi:MAG: DUF3365 domain-containing protein [bacterium]|nr:DUF3365 domain-containing protein [bacterium]
MKKNNKNSFSLLYRSIGAAIIVWTAIIAASLSWNIYHEHQQIINMARKEAIIHIKKDMAFRLWATEKGGVYAIQNSKTPPNQYLSHLKERDIKTRTGKSLTLMNPAYMMRQVMDHYSDLFGVKGKITSLKVLNPVNAPDPWERSSLNKFLKGSKEILGISNINGDSYFRFIRPLLTEKGCLKCHEHQGYKVGDIRGGLSIAVPMSPYYKIEKNSNKTFIINHSAIWIFGIITILFIMKIRKQYASERDESKKALMQEIKKQKKTEEEKSAALTELKQVFNISTSGIILIDLDYNILRVNKGFLKLFNLEEQDITGKKCYEFWKEQICKTENCPLKKIKGGEKTFEYTIEKTVGDKQVSCMVSSVPFYNRKGEMVGILEHFIDVSEMKKLERDIINISEEERQRIGQDLHDEVGQILTGSAFLVEVLDIKMDKKSYPEVEGLREIAELIDKAIVTTRMLSQGLNPVSMDDEGLEIALEEMAAEMEKVYGINCTVSINTVYPFKNNMIEASNIYYIAKESVNNAVKHGNAKNVDIILQDSELHFRLIVHDNGSGLNGNYKKTNGLGLKIMKHRAEMIGATLEILDSDGVTVKLRK